MANASTVRAAASGAAAVQTPVLDEAAKEVLHCVTSLLQGGDADEALRVLRSEGTRLPPLEAGQAFHGLVEAFLGQDRLDTATQVLTEMYRLGGEHCRVQGVTQELVLKAILQAQQYSRGLELLREASSAGAMLNDAFFNSVLDATVRARAYSEGWDALELLLANKRRADKYFVAILTKSLEASSDKRAVRRGISLVEQFIDHQREDVDEIVFNSLLNVLGNLGDMAKLEQTLNTMMEYKVPPSAVTYGTVVKAYGRAQDINAVLSVWQEMRNRRLGVNPVTCGCVLDACVKCGHLDKAMTIFQEMKMQGLHKNTVLYATLIKGFAKVRNLQGAGQLYQEMRYENVPCNLVAFNSLMDVCVRCGDMHAAAYFLQDMMNAGIEPDLITFSTLIKGYSQTGEVQKAMMLAQELKARGLKCDEIMYNSLIDGCARATRLEEGMEIFRDMVQSRVAPSNITFSILIKLHFEAGRGLDAFKLVGEMLPRYRCVPSRVVYAVLLRCAAQHGGEALARGVELLGELSSKRNAKLPDQSMVSAVVQGLVQHGDLATAVRIVKEDYTSGPNHRRGNCLVSLESLKSLVAALGAADKAAGLDLLEHLRQRPLGATHLAQLQTAFTEGQRDPAPPQWTAAASSPQLLAETKACASASSCPAPMPPAGCMPYPGMCDWNQGQFVPPQQTFLPECLTTPFNAGFAQPYGRLQQQQQPMGFFPQSCPCYSQGPCPTSPPALPPPMPRDSSTPLVAPVGGKSTGPLVAHTDAMASVSSGHGMQRPAPARPKDSNKTAQPRQSERPRVVDKENEAPEGFVHANVADGGKKGHKGRGGKLGGNQAVNEVRNQGLLI